MILHQLTRFLSKCWNEAFLQGTEEMCGRRLFPEVGRIQ